MSWNLLGGRRLLLAGSAQGAFWIAAGLVAVVLLWVLYRAERRLVSQRAGLFLLGLRLLAAVALVAALFEPIAARVLHEVQRGRVVVAVDVSRSMETADPGRSSVERQELAQTLAAKPGEDLATVPRREVARRLLDRPDAPVAKLAREHELEALAFARTTAPASLAALAGSLQTPARSDDPLARETDWEPALASALREDGKGAPVLGVVLLTDGRDNASPMGTTSPAVDRLAARGIPIYPVLIGSTVPPRDAAIASVRAPESVYRGDVAAIEATLKIDGYPGREVAVTLERPKAPPQRRIVRAPADDRSPRPVVSFRVPLEESGTATLTLTIGPLEGDVEPANDRSTVAIQVVDDKARVLLVDGEARWEFRYLRNALARDPHVSVRSVILHPPEAGAASRTTYERGLPAPAAAAPSSSPQPDPLGSFEAIWIGDVNPADLAPADWARLEAYVAERGGTLILSPGPRWWVSLLGLESFRKLAPLFDPHPVAIDDSSVDPNHPALAPGVSLVPSASAAAMTAWPMLGLAEEAAQNVATWAGLPRLPWVLAGREKPGATVLATAGGGEGRAAVVAQPYGLGKVLWVGTDGTWRWRHRVGDAHHHRFWGQVIRWSTTGKLAAGNRYVRFGPIRPRALEGEGVPIQARISEGVLGVSPDLLIAARIFRADPSTRRAVGEPLAVVPLSPAAGQPRTFEGSAPALAAGAYAVRLDVPQLAGSLQLHGEHDGQPVPEARLDIVTRTTSELVELAAARDPLERLAAATGGRVLADREAGQLPGLLHARITAVTRTVETPLWDQPATLVVFFSILTVEWIARKRLGLP